METGIKILLSLVLFTHISRVTYKMEQIGERLFAYNMTYMCDYNIVFIGVLMKDFFNVQRQGSIASMTHTVNEYRKDDSKQINHGVHRFGNKQNTLSLSKRGFYNPLLHRYSF